MTLPRFTIWSCGRNLKTSSPTPTLRAIDSVMAQTRGDWEMLLVEDCSDDGTMDWLLPQMGDPRIRFTFSGARNGKLANFTALMPCMSGEIAIELDADDWLLRPDTLALVVAAYDDPEVDVTLGRWPGSGNISIDSRQPHGPMGYDALRTWRVPLMRLALAMEPDVLIDSATGRLWESSADAATMAAILPHARKVVDLGVDVYGINDHGSRDGVVDRATQHRTTTAILRLWEQRADAMRAAKASAL